ncbi:MAG: hypothetical protein EA352_00475 [Gemmatimonadales bacterium]|nr:MAG: hypothetical protein EA352_00475 [Gemmatimonadales bacterium]
MPAAPFSLLALSLALVAVLFLVASVRAFGGRRWVGSVGSVGAGLLFLSLAALVALLGVSLHGYRALVHEEVAAVVTTVPTGPASFQAFVEFPSGRDTTFHVAGDQLLVDARILKWHPWANFLGLHTHYELDRLGGRYVDIEAERTEPRTVHALGTERPGDLDLFHLARRWTPLAFLVDTEYGSATYVEVRRPAHFEIRVSTTGLLVREAGRRGAGGGAPGGTGGVGRGRPGEVAKRPEAERRGQTGPKSDPEGSRRR